MSLCAFARILAPISLAVASVGCSTDCRRNSRDEPTRYEGGRTVGQEYATSPISGPYVYFPSGIRLDLQHGLGKEPVFVDFWVSFNETGELTPSAGNQSIMLARDAESILVKNDSCEDFYLWAYARSSDLWDGTQQPTALEQPELPIDAALPACDE